MSLDHRHGNGDWTDDPRDLLRVGEGFDLAAFDRGATPGWGTGKTEARAHMEARGELMSELQERLFAEGRTGAASRCWWWCRGSTPRARAASRAT